MEFDRDLTSEEAIAQAARLDLERPTYEDALYFGIEYPDVQRDRPVVFLHEPWFGYFGRWDVLCLWSNAGRRELGLEDFDGRWSGTYRFAFVRTPGRRTPTGAFTSSGRGRAPGARLRVYSSPRSRPDRRR